MEWLLELETLLANAEGCSGRELVGVCAACLSWREDSDGAVSGEGRAATNILVVSVDELGFLAFGIGIRCT